MKIKHLYFDVFSHDGEFFNHMAQTTDGKWYLFHIPKTRELVAGDLHEIDADLAAKYVEHAVEFQTIVSSLRHIGLELV